MPGSNRAVKDKFLSLATSSPQEWASSQEGVCNDSERLRILMDMNMDRMGAAAIRARASPSKVHASMDLDMADVSHGTDLVRQALHIAKRCLTAVCHSDQDLPVISA